MASTLQASDAPKPFYCHHCSHQWMKAQDTLFECPRCREGFIEEVSDNFVPNIAIPAASPQLNFILYQDFSENLNRNNQRRSRAARNRNDGENNEENRRQTSRSRSPHVSSSIFFRSNSNREHNNLANDFRILFERRRASRRILSVAIDDIMGLIFTTDRQPVMTQEQLNEIPFATITSEQVQAELQCSICFEEFTLNEAEIRKLQCNHIFHEKCIFPWLRNNASCPVCRTCFANQADSDDDSSFIQIYTNNRQVNRPESSNNDEAGPSTSSGRNNNNNNDPHPASSSSFSARLQSRIPTYQLVQPTTSSSSSQQSLTNDRVNNSPVSHRTRSHSETRQVNHQNSQRRTPRQRQVQYAPYYRLGQRNPRLVQQRVSSSSSQHPSVTNDGANNSPVSHRTRSHSETRQVNQNSHRRAPRQHHAQYAPYSRPGRRQTATANNDRSENRASNYRLPRTHRASHLSIYEAIIRMDNRRRYDSDSSESSSDYTYYSNSNVIQPDSE